MRQIADVADPHIVLSCYQHLSSACVDDSASLPSQLNVESMESSQYGALYRLLFLEFTPKVSQGVTSRRSFVMRCLVVLSTSGCATADLIKPPSLYSLEEVLADEQRTEHASSLRPECRRRMTRSGRFGKRHRESPKAMRRRNNPHYLRTLIRAPTVPANDNRAILSRILLGVCDPT